MPASLPHLFYHLSPQAFEPLFEYQSTMKFPTALVAFVALSASALAKDDKKKPGEGECAKEQEYDMGCSMS